MKWLLTSIAFVAVYSTAQAQDLPPNLPVADGTNPSIVSFEPVTRQAGMLRGNTLFPNFIGFLSNPIESIDPRSVTTIWPIFGSAWASGNDSRLPSGNLQSYGAGLNVALTDRLSIGLNQGGYITSRFSNDRERKLADLGLPVRDLDRSGSRSGWLNLGGFVQYTLIADVQRQFILTAGMRWEAPSGSTQVFQGSGPAYLAPYLTVGKEFGKFHFLATTGYEFPAGTGDATSNKFYANFHIDRQFGWLYPLAEVNCSFSNSTLDLNVQTPDHGVVNLGTFSSTGNSVALAFGANAVLIPSKLEFGAVYMRPITSRNAYDFNGVLVKMVYRY